MGNYLCCEPVSDGANRVAVDTSANDFILEITPFGGWSFVTGAGVPIYYDSPENPTPMQKEFLKNLLDAAEKAMKTGDINEYSKYIDVDSFVDLYIMMELFKDVDGYWKSLYFYVKDGILYAGPPWDFDLVCGNVSTTYKEDNYYNYHNSHGYGDKSNDSTHGLRMNEGWWKILLATEKFSSLVRERYVELQPLIINLYEDNSEGKNQIDSLIIKNGDSFSREYKDSGTELNAGWDISKSYSIYAGESKGSYEDNVEFLRDWLIRRNAWLIENIGR
jgi:spore coat protein CotH